MTGQGDKPNSPVDWTSVRLTFADPSDECLQSHRLANEKHPEEMARLARILVDIAGRSLTELELKIEKPPKDPLLEADGGVVTFEGEQKDYRDSGPARIYRIRYSDVVSVLIAVRPQQTELVRFYSENAS